MEGLDQIQIDAEVRKADCPQVCGSDEGAEAAGDPKKVDELQAWES